MKLFVLPPYRGLSLQHRTTDRSPGHHQYKPRPKRKRKSPRPSKTTCEILEGRISAFQLFGKLMTLVVSIPGHRSAYQVIPCYDNKDWIPRIGMAVKVEVYHMTMRSHGEIHGTMRFAVPSE